MDTRALAVMLVVGLLAGWLASFVVGGSGLLRYILTGVIGSFVGGFVLRGFAIQLGINILSLTLASRASNPRAYLSSYDLSICDHVLERNIGTTITFCLAQPLIFDS